ncbi:cytoplasmic protein [Floricoccus penangensis]|uniref:Cytoplasmic protein n=1 Tax=Floricoccus penangensis TaxID=1859475 RepID=A0A9Q5JHW2_9LACT|nr:ClbS/DfsB family four-helix bundle protein [Floricoccus penangensis]OFI47887.1 cytoplasmic protein [Floricoccus penangensis]
MKSYDSKQELIDAIHASYGKYIEEFKAIPEDMKDIRIDGVDKTPAENLAYQLGWINLLLSWEKDEISGIKVITPTADYKWNNLGGLYQSFYENYAQLSLKERIDLLTGKVDELCDWLESLSDEELFEPEKRNWATTAAMWPIWKWVHINSVAPFTNFRTKIRKWKKVAMIDKK